MGGVRLYRVCESAMEAAAPATEIVAAWIATNPGQVRGVEVYRS